MSIGKRQRYSFVICHFWWKSLDKSIDVFKWDIADHHCGSNPNVCYWAVKEYGFYLAEYEHPKPDNLLHTYTWKKK